MRSYRVRQVVSFAMTALCALAVILALVPLAFILFFMGASNFLQVAASLFLSAAMIRLLNNNIPAEMPLAAAATPAPARQP